MASMIKLDNFIFGTLFFSLCTFAHTATPDQLREQAVIQARQGQVTEGLFQLEKLVQRYPTDQKILADYFNLSSMKYFSFLASFGKLAYLDLSNKPL